MDKESAKQFLARRRELDGLEADFQASLANHQPAPAEAEGTPELTAEERYKALSERFNALPITQGGSEFTKYASVRLDEDVSMFLRGEFMNNVETNPDLAGMSQHYMRLSVTWAYHSPVEPGFADIPRPYHAEVVNAHQTDAAALANSVRADEPSLEEVERRLGLMEESFTEFEAALAAQTAAA